MAVLAVFHNLKFSFGFDLLALAKAECFKDNSFYSLFNFCGGKYVKSALRAFFCMFLGKSRKVGLTSTMIYLDCDLLSRTGQQPLL